MTVDTGLLVQTDKGAVSGYRDGELSFFRGIPFAAPPFGANRFRYPQPVEPWEGVRDGTVRGLGVPQPIIPGDDLGAYFNPHEQGEDCLNLEVITPDPTATGLPVMVWIHGGGYMNGSGSAPGYSGSAFARDGIVHVGINYRLGIDGFLYLGEGTDNLGLRDQVAALEWVQRNIASFGGDPADVTIYGQSGGAVAVMQLMAMPAAQGLFVRASAISGSPAASVAVDDAEEVTTRTAELLGISPDRDAFAALSIEDTVNGTMTIGLDFFAQVERWGARGMMISPFRAVHGTPSLPEPALAVASRSGIPLLTGTTLHEATAFLQTGDMMNNMPPAVAAAMLGAMGADATVQAAYTSARGITTDAAMAEAAWTDWAFRIPTLQLLDLRTAPSFLYQFVWESPAFPVGMGSIHALDVPFIRDDLAGMRGLGPIGEMILAGAPQEVASRMHADWVRFATTGDPGWPAYEPEARSTMVYGNSIGLTNDFASAERNAWNGKR